MQEENNTKQRNYPFKKGQSGNPAGRPKGKKMFSEVAREMMQSKKISVEYTFPKDGKEVTRRMDINSDKPIYYSMAAAMIRESLNGNVKAFKELIDRTEGTARSNIDVTTNGKDIQSQTLLQVVDQATLDMCQRIVNGDGREESVNSSDGQNG